jgi:polar amino acid transport system substrate-binding protein
VPDVVPLQAWTRSAPTGLTIHVRALPCGMFRRQSGLSCRLPPPPVATFSRTGAGPLDPKLRRGPHKQQHLIIILFRGSWGQVGEPAAVLVRRRVTSLLTTLLVLVGLLLLSRFLGDEMRIQRYGSPPIHGTVTMGWHSHFPYQYEKSLRGQKTQTGLDTELMRLAFERAGYRLQLVERDWDTALKELKAGQLQALSLGSRTPERDEFAYFSRPYLTLNLAIFYPHKSSPRWTGDLTQLNERFRSEKLRFGYGRGYFIPDELVKLLKEPGCLVQAEQRSFEVDLINDLASGKLDLVVADELAGRSLILRNGWSNRIDVQRASWASQTAHIMFSKASTSPEMVERVDEALQSLESDGSKAAVTRGIHYPTLLTLLTRSFWFEDIFVLAAVTAAINGIVLAHRERCNLVGAFLMAAAPAAGGGLVRDLVAGRSPVGMVADPAVLGTVVWIVLCGFLGFRLAARFAPHLHQRLDELDPSAHPVLVLLDAISMASFTVIGVMVALDNRCEPLWLWGPFLAALANGGGALIRDILLQRPSSVIASTTPQPEIAAGWGLILSLYLIYTSGQFVGSQDRLEHALLLTMAGVILTRLAVLKWDLRLPLFRAEIRSSDLDLGFQEVSSLEVLCGEAVDVVELSPAGEEAVDGTGRSSAL